MNGAVPKADFVRGQNRLIGKNHVEKKRFFEAADLSGSTAVGMQKGKNLLTKPVDVSAPARHAVDPHTPHSTKASYGYSGSGEFIQTGGPPRSKFLKPLSKYKSKERKQLIEFGTISPDTYEQPSGGDNSYLLGGNTAMRNWVDTANQKI